jgi:hypothetical protein
MANPADNLRDAVERTVDATLGSAERSRSAAQGALDDLGQRLARGRRSMTEAIEGRRPASYDDIKELRAELRAIGRRLDKIEERLPAKRSAPKKRSSSKGSSAKRSS